MGGVRSLDELRPRWKAVGMRGRVARMQFGAFCEPSASVNSHVSMHSVFTLDGCMITGLSIVQRFQAVTSQPSGQVLRYCIDPGAEPVWGRSQPLPGNVDPCPNCGAQRRFEFQLLPQLLAFLGVDESADDSLDWCAQCSPWSVAVKLLLHLIAPSPLGLSIAMVIMLRTA